MPSRPTKARQTKPTDELYADVIENIQKCFQNTLDKEGIKLEDIKDFEVVSFEGNNLKVNIELKN